MLKRCKRSFLLLAVAVLADSGCGLLAPSDDTYEIGVARIGEQLYVFAPLCDDERIASVEAYDNEAAGKEPDYDPNSMKFTYWKVAEPTDTSASRGLIVVDDDSAYRTVTVAAGSNIDFPRVVGVTFLVNDSHAGHTVGGAFRVSKAPTYPVDANPKDVKYGYNLGSKKEERLTADEILDRSKCALEYPA